MQYAIYEENDMSTREEIISSFYRRYDEDGRTLRSRHGQLEYCTTMSFIHRFTTGRSRILEIGAGTGRYSIALAKEGMDVTAVELVESNLEALRENGKGLGNLRSFQADATDLSRFPDDAFDATLCFGPMYHLYERNSRLLRNGICPFLKSGSCWAPQVISCISAGSRQT